MEGREGGRGKEGRETEGGKKGEEREGRKKGGSSGGRGREESCYHSFTRKVLEIIPCLFSWLPFTLCIPESSEGLSRVCVCVHVPSFQPKTFHLM